MRLFATQSQYADRLADAVCLNYESIVVSEWFMKIGLQYELFSFSFDDKWEMGCRYQFILAHVFLSCNVTW